MNPHLLPSCWSIELVGGPLDGLALTVLSGQQRLRLSQDGLHVDPASSLPACLYDLSQASKDGRAIFRFSGYCG